MGTVDPEFLFRFIRELKDALAVAERYNFIGVSLNDEHWNFDVPDLRSIVELIPWEQLDVSEDSKCT